ncbi:MAG: carbohydrate-binding family 9-like protein [Verrucomicrobia bacterium]|nr:carbohydrate-binding family 9-like protein [Verrucomicrobiota bacterium]
MSSPARCLAWFALPATVAGLVLASSAPRGQPFRPPEYTVLRAATPPVIDGRLDEAAWFGAPDVGEFVFTWWKAGTREQTRLKLLWDDECLYLAALCQDAHITARHTERDGKIPEDDCLEVMLAPNAATPHVYFNIEFNVIGGILDNFRPNGPDKPRAPKWDAEGVRIAGSQVGTLNDDTDLDQSWQVEVAIPWKNFAAVMRDTPPRPGTVLHANFNRHGGRTNPQYSQWSPADTPKPSFHTPDRFGRITLSARPSPFATPATAP